MRTLLNNLYAHIGYDDYGYLVHTAKKSGKQKISVKRWPDVQSAKVAVSNDLGKIEWEDLNEPPSAA